MKNNPKLDQIDEAIAAFWCWFLENHSDIEAMLDRDDTTELTQQMNTQIDRLSLQRAWEIGPGLVKPYMLVFPTAGNSENKAAVSRIMDMAPTIKDWEFHVSRPVRPFPPTIQLPAQGLSIQTSDWRFLLKRSPNSNRFDLQVLSDQLISFDERTSLTAVFILLDAALGEDMVERWIGDIKVCKGDREGLPLSEVANTLAGGNPGR